MLKFTTVKSISMACKRRQGKLTKTYQKPKPPIYEASFWRESEERMIESGPVDKQGILDWANAELLWMTGTTSPVL